MVEDQIPDEIQKVRKACLSHAEDLLRASKRILKDENLPNLAYHLSALALEEVGKAEILGAGSMALSRDEYISWPEKHSEDHVKKLFWALWTPAMGRHLITGELMESYAGMAKKIHERRISGLYVDPSGKLPPPKEAVVQADAEMIISLTEARVGLANCFESRTLTDGDKGLLKWFLMANDDPGKRNLLMGQKSMEKLAECKEAYRWISWLKDQFDKADEAARQAVEDEMNRQEPAGDEASLPKWQLTIRLQSLSHSIRQKPLNWWNDGVGWIKLQAIDHKEKQQLLVKILLPKQVPIEQVWWAGWGAARQFVVALNIGSFGHFWWYFPDQISRYYEKLTDVERGEDLKVERTPALKLDFKRGVLTEEDIRRVGLCLSVLPNLREKERHEPFGHYISGLTLWGKNDIHMQFEPTIFASFYKALKTGMQVYGDWDGIKSFSENFTPFREEWFPKMTANDWLNYQNMSEQIENRQPTAKAVTLEEVGVMKAVCDAYFFKTFRKLAEDRKKSGE